MTQPLSRRRFLGYSAGLTSAALAGIGTFGLPRVLSAAEKFPGFTIGLQSYSLRGYKADEAIEHAKELGFAGLEFFDAHFSVNSSDEQIAAMKKQMAAAGLKIMGHGVSPFGKDHEANRKYFEFAKKAGIKNLSADPAPDSFDSLDKLVEEYDVRIAIHNHGPNHRYNKVLDVVNAVRDHHKNIGACADLGHFIRSGENPVEVIKVLGDRLFGIHLKDFAEQKDQTKGVILGKGHLDVDGVFEALRMVNFPADGCLVLEYEENPENPLAEIAECLAIAKDAAQRASA